MGRDRNRSTRDPLGSRPIVHDGDAGAFCVSATTLSSRRSRRERRILELGRASRLWLAATEEAETRVTVSVSNPSRVPLLWILRLLSRRFPLQQNNSAAHSFPFALAPNATHAIWFVNTESATVVIYVPRTAKYIRFLELKAPQDQGFEPALKDYWILNRDINPDENLDESMM